MRVKPLSVMLCTALALVLQTAQATAYPPPAKPKPTPSVTAVEEWVDAATKKHGSTKKKTKSKKQTSPTPTPESGSKATAPGNLPQCTDDNTAYQCRDYDPDPSRKKTKKKAPSVAQIQAVAARLKLPDPTPRLGPDPSVNEWNMLAVCFPIWLWTDRPTQISTTAHHDGLTFTLTATWTSTTFTMGDGHTKTCTATTIRPKTVKPVTKPSPTCGYTYKPNPKSDTPTP